MEVVHRFYRFCGVFPFFLLLAMALASCAAPPRMEAATTASAPAIPPPRNDGAVKAAILLPLSGPNAALGQSMLQAAQLAVFDLGYEGLELVPQDTASGAGNAAGAAIADGADIILGPLFADDVRAAKSAATGRNIPVLAFSTDWSLAGGNTYIMGFVPFGQVERIAAFAATRGLKRAGIATPADAYGMATSTRFEEEAREREIKITRALSDAGGYDSVFIPAGAAALPSLLPRISNASARKLGTGLWDDARIAAMPAMNGAWFAAPAPSARAGFEKRFLETYGARPERLASLAYDATALAVTLAKNGGGFDANAITNPNGFAGVDGILRFNAQGIAERGLAVLEIRDGGIVEIDPAPASFVR